MASPWREGSIGADEVDAQALSNSAKIAIVWRMQTETVLPRAPIPYT
jgi:hypothetical protein